jgi:hypothetical protein
VRGRQFTQGPNSGGKTNTLGNMPSNYITKIGAGHFYLWREVAGKRALYMLHIDMGAHKQVILSFCRDMVVCCVAFFWGAVKLDTKCLRTTFKTVLEGSLTRTLSSKNRKPPLKK